MAATKLAYVKYQNDDEKDVPVTLIKKSSLQTLQIPSQRKLTKFNGRDLTEAASSHHGDEDFYKAQILMLGCKFNYHQPVLTWATSLLLLLLGQKAVSFFVIFTLKISSSTASN